jgi:hypothetical protein
MWCSGRYQRHIRRCPKQRSHLMISEPVKYYPQFNDRPSHLDIGSSFRLSRYCQKGEPEACKVVIGIPRTFGRRQLPRPDLQGDRARDRLNGQLAGKGELAFHLLENSGGSARTQCVKIESDCRRAEQAPTEPRVLAGQRGDLDYFPAQNWGLRGL